MRRLFIDLVERDQIMDGEQLPSEAALAATFEVSRNTVRELLVQLETEGLVLRSHGIGTFLRRRPKRHGTYQSFPQLIADTGRTPSFEMSGPFDCVPPEHIAAELNLRHPQRLQKTERILSADGVPIAYIIDYLPLSVAERFRSWEHATGDMVAMIGQAIGQNRFTQNVTIDAVACRAEMSEKLQLDVGAPLVHVHSLMQTMSMESVVVTDSYLRPGELPLEYLGTIRITSGAAES